MKASSPSSHIPEIDGLRAFAILAVMAFHLGLPGASFGWAGVEIFFVISGFLITGILLNTVEDERYLSKFYIRRALRIFPIYYLMLAFVAFKHGVGGSFGYYLTYLQTIPQLATSFGEPNMPQHTWTLAIEEQFYLLWPFVVMVFRKNLGLVCGGLLIYAITLRCFALFGDSPFWMDGWLPAQVDTLAMGAGLAMAHRTMSKHHLREVALFFLLIGLGGFWLFADAAGFDAFWTPYKWAKLSYAPTLITFFAFIGFGLVGLCSVSYRPLAFLRWSPLQHIGKISYGLYLYHPFVFDYVRSHVHGTIPTVAACGVGTYAVAITSWTLIERPIISLKDRLTKSHA